MRPIPHALSTVIKSIICATLMLGAAAHADEKKADPAGTWIWTMPGRNGGPDRTNTLTLKVDGDKLTGSVTAPGRGGQVNTTAIEDGKMTGGDVSFTVNREFNGNKITSKYSGKLSSDSIKGKIDIERDGDTQTRDWEAKRQAPVTDKTEKAADKAEQK